MNTKRIVRRPDAIVPTYLYEVDVDVEASGRIKTYRLTPGARLTVDWANPELHGLHKGTYTFFYAERVNDTLLIYADWRGVRKTLREGWIKTVREIHD